jgi:hypothetical protein
LSGVFRGSSDLEQSEAGVRRPEPEDQIGGPADAALELVLVRVILAMMLICLCGGRLRSETRARERVREAWSKDQQRVGPVQSYR